MRARVYDKDTDSYFISEVYAIINTGWYKKYLVVQEIDRCRYFRLFEYLDKTKVNGHYPVKVNIVSRNTLPVPWVEKMEEELSYFNNILKPKDKYDGFYEYKGYAFILEQKEYLLQLIQGDKVPYENIMGDKEICTKLDGWNYIESDEDIGALMQSFNGFHDSVIVSLSYISGSKQGDDGMFVFDDIRQVSMIFDSDWAESIEIVFEGTLTLHLRPAGDNYDSIIFSSTLMIEEKTIFFYDDDVDEVYEDYGGTWVNALGMRWRFVL